jgi:hypothetical protein
MIEIEEHDFAKEILDRGDYGNTSNLIREANIRNKEIESNFGKKMVAATSFFCHGSEMELFLLLKKKGYKRVPFNFEYNFNMGHLNIKHVGLVKNMFECYASSVFDGIECITEEPITMRFFKPAEKFISHNVFTSMIYSACVLLGMTKDKIYEYMMKNIGISNIDKIILNYNNRAATDPDCMKLTKLETKIFFWWNIHSRGRKPKGQAYLLFYIWCFRNIFRINTPTLLGNSKLNAPEFPEYFRLIDECNDEINLFILRYGPLHLSIGEIKDIPTKIFTFYRRSKCEENLAISKECSKEYEF